MHINISTSLLKFFNYFLGTLKDVCKLAQGNLDRLKRFLDHLNVAESFQTPVVSGGGDEEGDFEGFDNAVVLRKSVEMLSKLKETVSRCIAACALLNYATLGTLTYSVPSFHEINGIDTIVESLSNLQIAYAVHVVGR